MSNKKKITDTILEGFLPVEDLVPSPKKQQDNRQTSDFTLYNFLEKEEERLKKIEDFFLSKLPIQKEYPQQESIIADQAKSINLLKKRIIHSSMEDDSPLNKHLEHLFTSGINPK